MNKKLLLILLISIFTTKVYAQQRSIGEVRSIALQHIQKKDSGKKYVQGDVNLICTPSSRISKKVRKKNGNEAFYLCSSSVGSTIVSADERMDSILGYSDTPIYNIDSIPNGLQYLLDLYATEYELISDSGYVSEHLQNNVAHKVTAVTKGPLIKTQWGQNEPYNNNCPTKSGVHCVTGCVATAMAQIMNYYKYPNDGTFDWDNMDDTYISYTSEQAAAVAKLMRSCGTAVNMSYGTGTSAASDEKVDDALVSSFGYLGSISWVERNNASYDSWCDLITNEIDNQHPVYYSGKNTNNYNSIGHVFIVDGYKTTTSGTTYFHVNFGWDGSSDGYYSIGNLNGYKYYQGAYVNIKTGNESISQDGGVYQAGELYVSPTMLVQGKSTRLSLNLNDAKFCRYEDMTKGSLKAYFVNVDTKAKYYISGWSPSSLSDEDYYHPVSRNKSYTPSTSMPTGTYYVQFYSTNGSGELVPVTVSNSRKYIEVVKDAVNKSYVDLGLSSKTLWANENIGAYRPEDAGLFYAWAETDATKSQYTTSTNKYYSSGWTKYTTSDSKTVLEASDDAATATWGSEWVMPTYTQMKELVSSCTWTFTTINNVEGYNVVGPNGNSIFIPMTGIIGSNYTEGDDCSYWTSTRYNDSAARILRFTSSEVKNSYYGNREYGRPIRPVYYKPMVNVTSISLSNKSLEMTEGDKFTLTATVSPTTAFNKAIVWTSSNTNVATVSNGVITALSAGEAIITATAADGSGVTAKCTVTVKFHEQKELIYTENFGEWTSTDNPDNGYESKSYSIYAEKGDELAFDWFTSSEYEDEDLDVVFDGTVILDEIGVRSGSFKRTIESNGTHTLIVEWVKYLDESRAGIKNIRVNHYKDIIYSLKNNSIGSWTSTNNNDSSTGSQIFSFTSEDGDMLNFTYTISSEANYDYGYVYIDGNCIVSASGDNSATKEISLSAGSHTLLCKYVKDSSDYDNSDCFSVNNICLTRKDIKSTTGLSSVPLSSNVNSIQVYKECTTPCSYTVPANDTKWQSMVIPFSLDHSQWNGKVEIAEIEGLSTTFGDNNTLDKINLKAKIIDHGTVEPNKPYLVRTLKNNDIALSNENATLSITSNSSTDYSDDDIITSILPVYSQIASNDYYVNDDYLIKATSANINVFHWYMTLKNKSTNSVLNYANNIDIVFKTTMKGDVNGDGLVNIRDVTVLVNILNGKSNDTYGNADVTGDNIINTEDVISLKNIILHK